MSSGSQSLFLTPRRAELLTWFRRNAAPLAEAYEGAVHLLDGQPIPGRVNFLSHAIRDISDRLVFVLDPQGTPSRVQYENAMDQIAPLWRSLRRIEEKTSDLPDPDNVLIDNKVASAIDALVQSHRERRERPSNFDLLFRYLMRNEPSRGEVNKRLVSDFKRIRDWFMKLAHFGDKLNAVDENELQENFVTFEGMLHSFVGDFFTGTADLDEVLRQANQ